MVYHGCDNGRYHNLPWYHTVTPRCDFNVLQMQAIMTNYKLCSVSVTMTQRWIVVVQLMYTMLA